MGQINSRLPDLSREIYVPRGVREDAPVTDGNIKDRCENSKRAKHRRGAALLLTNPRLNVGETHVRNLHVCPSGRYVQSPCDLERSGCGGLHVAVVLEPLSYLLAPLGEPDSAPDLPNLSEAFAVMTAIEFDSWLAAAKDGRYLR